jgi:acetyl-CoA carboxylase biotin carboxyl carrier protein
MSENKEKDLKKVKEIIDLMKTNDLIEVEIVDGQNKILIKRPHSAAHTVIQTPVHIPAPAQQPSATEPAPLPAAKTDDLIEINSPIVGTFYSAANPDSKPYIAVGDKVAPDTIVCIIEAMKVMNEIKAETAGTITDVLCKTGQAVEFSQTLFRVKPD